MSFPPNMPGEPLSSRPLHFFWVCDVSAKMRKWRKIELLNNAIRDSLPIMKQVAEQNPNTQVYIRTLAFGNDAKWMNPSMIPIEQFIWTDLIATGVRAMGTALLKIGEELRVLPMPDQALPPVIVLITNGDPTDDFNKGLHALMSEKWGIKAVRIAIAIGADFDADLLRKFIGNEKIELLNATNPQQLMNYIRWASTEAIQYASKEFYTSDENIVSDLKHIEGLISTFRSSLPSDDSSMSSKNF